ncbi:MAG: hypothetical protein AAFU73_23020 [Planctomycetota bacterium]
MTEQESEQQQEPQRNDECFFITPIKEEDSAPRRIAEAIVEICLNPILEGRGIRARAAHQTDRPDQITPHVMRDVVNARVVVADLTRHNPNVMYELGVRHSFGGPFILIAESGTSLPFDVNDSLVHFYRDDPKGLLELRDSLRPAMVRCIDQPESVESPVLQAIETASARERLSRVSSEEKPLALALSRIEDGLAALRSRVEEIAPAQRKSHPGTRTRDPDPIVPDDDPFSSRAYEVSRVFETGETVDELVGRVERIAHRAMLAAATFSTVSRHGDYVKLVCFSLDTDHAADHRLAMAAAQLVSELEGVGLRVEPWKD